MELANENRPVIGIEQARRGLAKWVGLVGWITICFAAAAAGAPFAPDDWYAQLNRPAFAPPDFVFGPVWTILYLSMAAAAWMVWTRDRLKETWRPLAAFLFQLVLNATWTWLFFGLHRIDWAMFDIVLLLAAILTTIVLFLRISRVAGLLLLPYLGWVTFATALNFEYWRLNP
jgi:tryptophan-rich sensory protein